MTEHEAMLRQARSDFAMYEELLGHPRTEVAECHVLHYLQTSAEKLAKAFLVLRGQKIGHNHRAFSRLAHALSQEEHRALKAIGVPDPAATARFLARATPVFEQIENLCPAVANWLARKAGDQKDTRPNAEYPWWQMHPQTGQDWLSPEGHTFAAFQWSRRSAATATGC